MHCAFELINLGGKIAVVASIACGGVCAEVASSNLVDAVVADLERPVRPGGVEGRIGTITLMEDVAALLEGENQ